MNGRVRTLFGSFLHGGQDRGEQIVQKLHDGTHVARYLGAHTTGMHGHTRNSAAALGHSPLQLLGE
eukprot:CAMPEP_0175026610 /NCGR_PEP_ID=MMETSP0005-20121125/17844_1 /TAXON_ID=420556 /ORGANISM="Ochromonas sp., Strain CCMP1393" /LENGTH=65 /DNA_ID=CAMNT_0016285745 /DNA_START=269 /DNA_END=466 /DNA_ORIENTATION=+